MILRVFGGLPDDVAHVADGSDAQDPEADKQR
jgi:hypothetical protein